MLSKELVKIAVKAVDGHVEAIDVIEPGYNGSNIVLRIYSNDKSFILKLSNQSEYDLGKSEYTLLEDSFKGD